MAKMKPKGKKVAGKNYMVADEKYDESDKTYRGSMGKMPDVSKRLKDSESEQGYSKRPRLKAQKKKMKPVSGQKKIQY